MFECSICLERSFTPGPDWHSVPLCGHWFHTACIEQWMTVSATCPLCRKPLLDSSLRTLRFVSQVYQTMMNDISETEYPDIYQILLQASHQTERQIERQLFLVSADITARLNGMKDQFQPRAIRRILLCIHPDKWIHGPPRLSADKKQAGLAAVNDAMRTYELARLKSEILTLMDYIQ